MLPRTSIGSHRSSTNIFPRDQKIRMVELTWQVADGSRDVFEYHVIRKLPDLIYADHGDSVAAKLKSRDAANFGA
ncbi:MAG: TerB family tellurite resistance protein [Betaproteobacteria bacterium]